MKIKIKYLYPFIREILKSQEDIEENSVIWNDFNKRFIELIKERFNTDSMRAVSYTHLTLPTTPYV